MPVYKYLGRNQSGAKVGGTVEANNLKEVSSYLSEKGITPLSIDVERKGVGTVEDISERFFGVKVRPQEVLVFARQMATLSSAGVPIIRAVRQLTKSARSKGMKKTLNGVADAIESGQSLSSAMRISPKVFSPIFVGVIEVGENTGHLDDAFLQLANFLEKRIGNRRRLISAIRYPLLVVAAIVVAVIIMNIFVIPKFSAIFEAYKAKLPVATRILIASSDFMTQHWLLSIFLIVAIVIGVHYLLMIPKVRYQWDRYKLRLPIIGPIQQRIVMTQFTWTFGMILHSGVPVLRGISLASGVTDNTFIIDRLLRIRDAVDQGEGFTRAASYSGLFDSSSLQMLEVGEETGNLDDMLSKVSLSYENEVDYDIKNLNDLLEPIILVVLGVFVAILALAIYMPLWELTDVMKV